MDNIVFHTSVNTDYIYLHIYGFTETIINTYFTTNTQVISRNYYKSIAPYISSC